MMKTEGENLLKTAREERNRYKEKVVELAEQKEQSSKATEMLKIEIASLKDDLDFSQQEN